VKTLEYYMNLPYRPELLPDPDEGEYVVRYPDLPGCITTGKTKNDALANAEDAKRSWLKAALEDGVKINEPSRI
jgi:predicted RNase H-like HicB family nuclease